MTDSSLNLVRTRNNYYRNSFRLAVVLLLIAVIFNLTLVGAIFYLNKYPPVDQYYASNPDGSVTKLSTVSIEDLIEQFKAKNSK